MSINHLHIRQPSVTWVLVANGAEARVYRYRKNATIIPLRRNRNYLAPFVRSNQHELTLLPDMVINAEPLSDFQVGYGSRGSFEGGQFSTRNMAEAHVDIRDEVKQNLVAKISEKLAQACSNRAFHHLIIVAGPKILGALRRDLNFDVLDCVIAEIDKDFTHDNPDELAVHLENALTEQRIVA